MAVMDKVDLNGDKRISLAELQQYMKANHEKLSVDLEAVLAFLDGDGLLGFDDFLRFAEAQGNMEEKGQGVKEAFEMNETNGIGFTTPGSFRGKDNYVDPKVSLSDQYQAY